MLFVILAEDPQHSENVGERVGVKSRGISVYVHVWEIINGNLTPWVQLCIRRRLAAHFPESRRISRGRKSVVQ